MAAIIRLVHASSAEPGPGRRDNAAGDLDEDPFVCLSHHPGYRRAAVDDRLAHAGPADGQEATPGNAMNPRAISSIVERDPEGLGIAENSRSPTGLLTVPAPLVKEPSKTSGGLLYRATVEFGGIGVGGDEGSRQVPRIQGPRQRRRT